jgi:hypothetical protein
MVFPGAVEESSKNLSECCVRLVNINFSFGEALDLKRNSIK